MKHTSLLFTLLILAAQASFSQGETQNTGVGLYWKLLGNANTDTSLHFVGTPDNRALTFRTNNVRRMTVSSTGNVGIGTINPTYKLDIVAPGNTIGLRLLSGNNAELTYISLGRTNEYAQIGACTAGSFFLDAQAGDMAIKNYNTGKILFGASFSANAHMSIITNGNVGINTVAPSQRLHVAGATTGVRFEGLGTGGSFITTPSATTDRLLFADATGILRSINNGTANQVVSINASGVPTWANGNFWSLSGNTLTGTELIGSTNAQSVRFFCNNTERMRINPTDGEVVVGAVASPYAGDMFAGVSTAALPFVINGYTQHGGSGCWGETLAASASGFSSVQGVYSGSGGGAGVLGNYNGTNTSNARSGVYGVLSTPTSSNYGAGVYGYSAIGSGNGHMGLLGNYNGASYGIGVYGIGFGGALLAGNNDVAVVGWRANNGNYSGYFNGNHAIVNGTKAASVGTTQGNQFLYCMESPGVWFEDFGSSQLEGGRKTIHLDPLFQETIVVDEDHPMHVFVQMEGESDNVYVVKDKTWFTVIERNNGKSNAKFSWRLVAKRVHFQDHRFGNDPVWGPGDTRQYMEYSVPPKIDYNENVVLQAAKRAAGQKAPLPPGFVSWQQIQKEMNDRNKYNTREEQPMPVYQPANSTPDNDAGSNKQSTPPANIKIGHTGGSLPQQMIGQPQSHKQE